MNVELLGDFEEVTVDQVADKRKESGMVVVVSGTTEAIVEGLKLSAAKLKNDYKFLHVKSEDNKVELIKEDEKHEQSLANLTKEEVNTKINELINAEGFDLVGEIGPENYRTYAERDLPFVWLLIK